MFLDVSCLIRCIHYEKACGVITSKLATNDLAILNSLERTLTKPQIMREWLDKETKLSLSPKGQSNMKLPPGVSLLTNPTTKHCYSLHCQACWHLDVTAWLPLDRNWYHHQSRDAKHGASFPQLQPQEGYDTKGAPVTDSWMSRG